MSSSSPPPSAFGREQIRPSARDLATYDAEALEWPPSANVSRGVAPPTLASSKGKGKGPSDVTDPMAANTSPPASEKSRAKKTVRIAQPTEEDVRYFQPAPREREVPGHTAAASSSSGPSRFKTSRSSAGRESEEEETEDADVPAGRFNLPLDGEDADGDAHSASYPAAPRMPMVASVQERPRRQAVSQGAGPSTASATPLPSGSSRFKAIKAAERRVAQATSSDPSGSARPVAPPTVRPASSSSTQARDEASHVAAKDDEALSGSQGDEEWLDENGKPMSAFRKARLKKQGLQPPGGIAKQKRAAPPPVGERIATPASQGEESEADDAPGSAEGDLPSLLQSISQENNERLRAMKEDEIAQDVKDLEAMFGKDLLEGLRQRKTGKASTSSLPAGQSLPDAADTSSARSDAEQADLATSAVPAQSSGEPPLPVRKFKADMIFFDSLGKALPVPRHPVDLHHGHAHAQYGLDHHDPSNEGYNPSSLLLMARSTIPSQRTVALSLLSRVCSLYPPRNAIKQPTQERLQLIPNVIPESSVVAFWLSKVDFHVDAALISIFLLTDRQRSVRSAALSTLRVSLLFGPALSEPSRATTGKKGLSTARRIIDSGLLSGFANVLRGDEEERKASRELIFQILLQLGEADAEASTALMQADRGRLLETLLQTGLRMRWPPSEESSDVHSTALPSPAAAELLLQLVRSSRANAERLVKAGSLDVLLRFVAVPPWTLSDSGDADADVVAMGYELLSTSLQIFHDLARYGFHASLVSRAWEVFQPIHAWSVSVASPTRQQQQVTNGFYRLLAIWTICATDPHQTTPEHEVTWSQAEGWIELSLDALSTLTKSRPDAPGSQTVPLCGVLSHIEVWLEGAMRNAPESRTGVIEQISKILAEASDELTAQLQRGLVSYKVDADAEDDDETRAVESFASSCEAAVRLLHLAAVTRASELEQAIRQSGQEFLNEEEALIRALSVANREQRQQTLSFVVSLMEDSPGAFDLPLTLSLLSIVRPGEESFACRLIDACLLPAAGGDPARGSLLGCLKPFYMECLGIRPNSNLESQRLLLHPPTQTRPEHLKRTMSLRPPPPSSRQADTKGKESLEESDAEEGEEDSQTAKGGANVELDPVTNTPLWTCPASGLPLRVDWPLLPLDDLLRSAESSVFNRSDNLPADWDPNERQVVQATLEFTNWILERLTAAEAPAPLKADQGKTLSATHVYFAAQKVFMLESGIQGDLKKWTGAVTGKDLFRDKIIAPLLARLLSLANRIPPGEEQDVNLEQVASEHLGEETTYYSFYTDLVGLYDSISYGDPSFALSLLPPTVTVASSRSGGGEEPLYAVDYRRLLWQDYAHLLPTMRMRVAEAPGGVEAYLSPPPPSLSARTTPRSDEEVHQQEQRAAQSKRDEALMLQCYLNALLPSGAAPGAGAGAGGGSGGASAGLAPKTHPLVFRIALDHLCSFLWREVRLEHAGGCAAADADAGAVEDSRDAERGERQALEGDDDEEKRKRRSLARALFSPATSADQGGGGGGAHPRLRDYLVRYDLRRQPTASSGSSAQLQPKREREREEIPLLPEPADSSEEMAGSNANEGGEGQRMMRARRAWLRAVLET